jgi:hypothetical protein
MIHSIRWNRESHDVVQDDEGKKNNLLTTPTKK